jgi:hypothetical protein
VDILNKLFCTCNLLTKRARVDKLVTTRSIKIETEQREDEEDLVSKSSIVGKLIILLTDS